MTRKRKNVEDKNPESSIRFDRFAEDEGNQKRSRHDGRSDGGQQRFPTELVRYLRQMSREEPHDEMVDVFMDRCLEEVSGNEELLLNYTEGCYVVEQTFLRSHKGAFEFLKRLQHRKRANRIQLVLNAASERTIEKLLYRLVPLTDEIHIEIISNWVELVIDNWQTLILDRSGSFFVRTLGRVLVGLTDENLKYKSTFEAVQEVPLKRIHPVSKAELSRLLIRVFDFVSMKDFLDVNYVSLIIQDYAAFDKLLKTRNGSDFARKFIQQGRVGDSWKQINSSRVWDSLIELIDEETHLSLFHSIKDDLVDLATDEYARFPLETLFKKSNSEEIAKEVSNILLPLFPEFLQRSNIPAIVGPTLELLAKHDSFQSDAIKIIQKHFQGDGNRIAFVPNLLTLNDAGVQCLEDEVEFDVRCSKLFGSIILDRLFQFRKKKALMKSFNSITSSTLNQMALHKIASHVFDGFARSSSIDLEHKKGVFKKLDLEALIRDSYGSRVFESFWFELEWTPTDREKVAEGLFLPLMSSTERNKFVGILLNKLHIPEFRENRRQWKSQLDKWIAEERQKRLSRLMFSNNRTHGGEKSEQSSQPDQKKKDRGRGGPKHTR